MSETFFCIDDSNFARMLVKNVLGKLNYQFLGEASDALESISQLKFLKSKGKKIDYITLDISMPGTTGDTLLPKILEIHPKSRVIMMTSIANKETVKRCIDLGAKGYILKPITEEKFLEALNIITIKDLINKKENREKML